MNKNDYSMEGIRKAIRELIDSQKKTEELVKKTNKSVARLTDGWGMFVEGFVAPSIPKIFANLGFSVAGYGTRQKRNLNGATMEIDVLAVAGKKRNSGVVIAVSVKSRLSMSDVRDHIRDLRRLFKFFPEYNGSELIGVIAGIRLDEGAVSYGEKNGLYVIGSSPRPLLGKGGTSGDAVELLNKKGFKPRIWGGNRGQK